MIENFINKIINESTFPKSSEVETINNQFLPKTSSHSITSIFVTPNRTSFSANIPHPSSSIKPANSITSSSGISSRSHLISSAQKSRNKSKTNINVYAGAIEALADSIKQPIIVTSTNASANNPLNNISDPVDMCMIFVGSMLKYFKNEMLKFEVMHTLVQIVINANITQDSETTRHTA